MEQQHDRKIRAVSLIAALCLAAGLLTGCGGSSDNAPPPPAPSSAPPVEQPAPAEPEPDPEPPASSPAEPAPEPEPDPIGDAGVLDYVLESAKGVEATYAGKSGVLGIVKVKITNPTAFPAQLHYTLSALGSVTTDNAADGLPADKLLAAQPEAKLAVSVLFEDAAPKTKPVVAAVDAASPEIGAGESVTGYWYFFLTEDELCYKKLEWMKDPGDGYQILGAFPLPRTP